MGECPVVGGGAGGGECPVVGGGIKNGEENSTAFRVPFVLPFFVSSFSQSFFLPSSSESIPCARVWSQGRRPENPQPQALAPHTQSAGQCVSLSPSTGCQGTTQAQQKRR